MPSFIIPRVRYEIHDALLSLVASTGPRLIELRWAAAHYTRLGRLSGKWIGSSQDTFQLGSATRAILPFIRQFCRVIHSFILFKELKQIGDTKSNMQV